MSKLNVKKGDTVVVISGKDKGKQGKILVAMPAHEPPSEPGRRHNQKILARWQARQREERRGHVARMAGILSAGARLVPERDEADDLSERLLSMLDSAFEVVPTMAEDANPAA